MNPLPRHYCYRGFTLVEILIAMTLLVLVVTLGYSALHFAGRSWQAMDRGAERIEDQRLIAQFLRRQLEQAVPLMVETNGTSRILFKGESDSLIFVGRLPVHRGAGLHLIRLAQQGRQLTLDYRPIQDADSLNAGFDEQKQRTLLENIEAIEFAYYGPSDMDRPAQWRSHWHGPRQPPQLIRLIIRPADQPPRPAITTAYQARPFSGRPELMIRANRVPAL